MPKRPSYYIQGYGPDPKVLSRALTWLAELASQQPSKGRALLAVTSKSNLDGHLLEDVLGVKAVKELKASRELRASSSLSLTLFTERDGRVSWNGPLIAVYPSKSLLDKVDTLTGLTDVIVVPWTMDGLHDWINTWDAIDIDGASPPERQPIDPVVREALAELTRSVNLASGLAHPLDRSSTIEMLELLYHGGYQVTPESVRAVLVGEMGWSPDSANDVEVIYRDIIAGKRLRAQRGRWPRALERWKAAAGRNS